MALTPTMNLYCRTIHLQRLKSCVMSMFNCMRWNRSSLYLVGMLIDRSRDFTSETTVKQVIFSSNFSFLQRLSYVNFTVSKVITRNYRSNNQRFLRWLIRCYAKSRAIIRLLSCQKQVLSWTPGISFQSKPRRQCRIIERAKCHFIISVFLLTLSKWYEFRLTFALESLKIWRLHWKKLSSKLYMSAKLWAIFKWNFLKFIMILFKIHVKIKLVSLRENDCCTLIFRNLGFSSC